MSASKVKGHGPIPERTNEIYWEQRHKGKSADEAYCYAAYRQASQNYHSRPLKDDETMLLVSVDPYVNKVSDILAQQVAYWEMRLSGQSHKMAELLATRSFPGVHGTSSTFMTGTHAQDTPYDDYRYRAAKEANVDTNGKRYISGLAAFPGDPRAWVSGIDDVKKICEERGWNCKGMVEYDAPIKDVAPTPDVPIADDIVQQHVDACLRGFDEREITPKLIEEIKDSVTQELTGQVDLSPEPRVGVYSYEDSIRTTESA